MGMAVLFLLSACAGTLSHNGVRIQTLALASAQGFSADAIIAAPFRLLVLMRGDARTDAGRLSVYIEGDGAPWATPWHPPRDPTPTNSTVLALARADPAAAVVYLGRPCQYLDAAALAACAPAWWRERRYAAEVVAAYEQALSILKARLGATRLRLIGHSGGGVLATLLAQRRTDVEQLVTVAAPLALNAWLAWHDLSPLSGSLDPLAQTGKLPPALHWAGGRDRIVPPHLIEHFAHATAGRIMILPEQAHDCCWAREWPRLLALADRLHTERGSIAPPIPDRQESP